MVLASYTQVASHDDLNFFRKKIDFEVSLYSEGLVERLLSCFRLVFMTRAIN